MSYTPPIGDASTIKKGVLQLAGDLAGTATAPTVAKINTVSVSGTPNAGEVLKATGASTATWQSAASGGGGSQSITYVGTLQLGTGVMPLYNDSGVSRTITSVRASVGTAPGGTSILVDVNVAGTTIFPTQSQRPAIASAATTSGAVTRSATWGTNQALTVDIDQVGSTTAGADLIVTIEYS